MEQESSKNEKIAYRLADILTSLNMGEKLTVKGLAEKYQTHARTISRDLNERLAFLPLEQEGDRYFLPSAYLGKLNYQDELIAKVFRNSGIYMFESVHERM